MTDVRSSRPAVVDFHFDIMCPYAYQTSLWIRNVRAETGLDIRWKFFSLEEVNRTAWLSARRLSRSGTVLASTLFVGRRQATAIPTFACATGGAPE